MTDDLSNRGAQDRTRISLTEAHEVRYWTKEFGISFEELQKLVKEHGHSVAKVREALGK